MPSTDDSDYDDKKINEDTDEEDEVAFEDL